MKLNMYTGRSVVRMGRMEEGRKVGGERRKERKGRRDRE